MAKSFSLTWVFEPFETHSTFLTKPMFGGLSAYLYGRMVMVIMETPGVREYKGITSNFDLWNGVLLPMERSSHDSLMRDFPDLVSHPVLGKWLYLPMSSPNFESHMERISQLIKQDDMRFGVYPKPRGEKSSKKKKIQKKAKASRKKSVKKSMGKTTMVKQKMTLAGRKRKTKKRVRA